MFKKILIANRGEIACRIIKTAKRLGLGTVAVYSDADKDGLHVRMADEAVAIGGSASVDSYLRADRIIEACLRTGAEAVHPGYGFLSENAQFAKDVASNGVVFIGPSAHAITAMGDKITSKGIAKDAGVNVIPGHAESIENADEALTLAREIGFPVMLKASAGGGGKGMRIARDDAQCREGFERARNEARASFNDERIFIEKFIEEPRHIEIQVLGDHHGNLIHLGERECSIQRRHQKIIEEAPSVFLDDATREAMGKQALALAAAVEYASAGTVEFIVDQARNFYFLEMNTRLQVEHPVTEHVTGLDLVEQMIRVAAGERLSLTQQQIRLNGWAIESRIYAEDPAREFMPSTGRLVRYAPPEDDGAVRLDTGVSEGSEISVYYDPMMAKLITFAPSREAALERMCTALDEFVSEGVANNIEFLSSVIRTERFRTGALSTAFIDAEYPHGYDASRVQPNNRSLFIALAAWMHDLCAARPYVQSEGETALSDDAPRRWSVVLADAQQILVCVAGNRVYCDEFDFDVSSDWRPGEARLLASVDGDRVCVRVKIDSYAYSLSHAGQSLRCRVLSSRVSELVQYMPEKIPVDMSAFVLSPMPGLLLRMLVAEGEQVKAGQEVAVVEAMKMENVLRADSDRTVGKILVREGESLAADQALLEYLTPDD